MRNLMLGVLALSVSLVAEARDDGTYVRSAMLKGADNCPHEGPSLGNDALPRDLRAVRKKNYGLLLGGHCIGVGNSLQ
jgi:hypothetical protein